MTENLTTNGVIDMAPRIPFTLALTYRDTQASFVTQTGQMEDNIINVFINVIHNINDLVYATIMHWILTILMVNAPVMQ